MGASEYLRHRPLAWYDFWTEAHVHGSAITTKIGGLGFELIGASYAPFPAVAANPVCSIQGDVVGSIWEADVCYLLIDHRVDASPDRLARIELWQPTREGEVPLAGLFVVADTHAPTAAPSVPSSLAALAATILTA